MVSPGGSNKVEDRRGPRSLSETFPCCTSCWTNRWHAGLVELNWALASSNTSNGRRIAAQVDAATVKRIAWTTLFSLRSCIREGRWICGIDRGRCVGRRATMLGPPRNNVLETPSAATIFATMEDEGSGRNGGPAGLAGPLDRVRVEAAPSGFFRGIAIVGGPRPA